MLKMRLFASLFRNKSQDVEDRVKLSTDNVAMPRSDSRSARWGESGNVFFTLFGAVAVVGVLGAGIMSTMRGPLSTMVEVNRLEEAKAEMRVGGRLALVSASLTDVEDDMESGAPNPDDTYVEGLEPTASGGIPNTISAEKNDPWGTQYQYCAWDHGNDPADYDGEGRILAGTDDPNAVAIAIISAGPDRTFQTGCAAHPDYLIQTSDNSALSSFGSNGAGDDLMEVLTYTDAIAGSGGLWTPSDATTAAISRDLDVSGSAQLSGNLSFSAAGSSLVVPNQAALIDSDCDDAGDSANKGILRINETTTPDTLEVCSVSGATYAWVPVGEGAAEWLNDGSGNISHDGGDVSTTQDLTVGGAASVGSLDAGSGAIVTTGTLGAGASTLGATGVTSLASSGAITGTTITGSGLVKGSGLESATDLTVATTSTLGGKLTVNDDADVTGTLDITTDLVVDGNVTLGDALTDTVTIAGVTTIGSTLGVTGDTTVAVLKATGAVDFDSTLNVDGNTTLVGTVGGSGGGDLEVTAGIKLGNSAACAGTDEGTIRYSGTKVQYCNGSTWKGFTIDKLREIDNVGITADPTDKYLLMWDDTGKEWVPVDPATLDVADADVADEALKLEDDDNDTKIQVEEAADDDTIRFDTFGDERMVIAKTGEVGIGTDTPVQNLHIAQETGSSDLVFTNDTSGHLITDGLAVGLDTNGLDGVLWNKEAGKLSLGTSDTTRVLVDADGDVGIGTGTTVADASSILEVKSTSKGFLPPRMTESQRDGISSPVIGLQVYNTDTTYLECYNGTVWGDCSEGGATGSGGGGTSCSIESGDLSQAGTITHANLADARSVVVVGDYAYVTAHGAGRFTVVDISNPASPSITGSVTDAALSAARGLVVIGDYAYVAAQGNYFVIVDISNPASPSVTGSLTNANLASARGIDISGNYAYVTSSTGGLNVIDISTPASPSALTTLAIAGANSVSISGDYAYVGSGGGLYVVDISTPASPTQVGSLVTGNKDAVKVRGDYVYMSAGGTDFSIVDVSTPTSPVQVGTVAIRVDAIKLVGDYAYTVSYSNDSMTVIDVSDPTSPTSVDTITNANLDQSWGVDVVGTYVYVASAGTADALTVIDTGCDPSIVTYDDTLANLTCTDGQIVSWDDTGSEWVCADGGGSGGGLTSACVPDTLEEVGFLSSANIGVSTTVLVSGDYAYVSSFDGDKLTIIDVSDPTTPVETGTLTNANLNGIVQVALSGNYAYAASFYANSLTVIDISNPASPTEVGTVTGANLTQARGIDVAGNYAYVTAYGADALTVVDISNPAAPVEVGSVTSANLNGARKVSVVGDYAYVAAELSDSIVVIDVSDPTAPAEVGVDSNVSSNAAWDIDVSGGYAYVAAYSANALTIFDISNSASPTHVGALQNANLTNAGSVTVSGSYAYVAAEGSDALTVIDISDPATPAEVGSITNAHLNLANGVSVAGQYAYVVTQANHLSVIDLGCSASGPAALSSAKLIDSDNDTQIWVEKTTDEDKIRFDTAGSERMIIDDDGGVGVGTSSPDSTALMDLSSTAKGFLPPRMTETQRDNISSPATGLQVYNTTDSELQCYNGSAWGSCSASLAGAGDLSCTGGGVTWAARAVAEANAWRSVAYGNGQFVAVSADGVNRVMTSPDGVTWTAQAAAEANSWSSVTYGGGQFVAVSQDGTNRVMTSPDGVTWTAQAAAEANAWTSVTYGGGQFVAVSANGTNRVMTSPDGVTWTAQAAAEANSWNSVTYGNGTFVAVATSGTNRVMTSPDGVTWTAQAAAEANVWSSVTYGNGTFVAVATSGTNRVMTSPDGVTWTAQAASSASVWISVAYGNDQFVSVAFNDVMTAGGGTCTGGSGVSSAAKVSDDDADTQIHVEKSTDEDKIRFDTEGVERVIIDDDGGVGVGTSSPDSTALMDLSSTAKGFLPPRMTETQRDNISSPATGLQVYNTTDSELQCYNGSAWGSCSASLAGAGDLSCTGGGVTWTAQTAAEANLWYDVTYGNGVFVAVAQSNANRVMTSPDGVTWTAQAAAEANLWYSVTYGGGQFVAVSADGTNRVMTSPDGVTWTAQAAAEANGWTSVTYGGGQFVAVSADGTNRVMTSPDGVTWTAQAAAEANLWRSVVYGDGQFVAVAQDGANRVMTSPDGVTWTAQAAAEANLWYSVTYGNGVFVAVSVVGTNRVMTSPDGVTWTAQTAAEANNWYDVTYGNGQFVAVGQSGTNRVMTSPDGVTWTAQTAAEANAWTSVTYGGGKFVAVTLGGGNQVMTAGGGTCTGGSGVSSAAKVSDDDADTQIHVEKSTDEDKIRFDTEGVERVIIDDDGGVGVGTSSPDSTAILDVDSTTKGFLAPRMTETQRDAISFPATGLQVYNTDTTYLECYNGTVWGDCSEGGATGSGGGGTSCSIESGDLSQAGTITHANLAESRSVVVVGDYAYVTAYGANRFTVVDISNPASPSITGSVTDAALSAARGLVVVGNYAYVAAQGGYFTIVDISNPASPSVTGSLTNANLASARGIDISGNYAYVTSSTGGLNVIDISTPASPSALTTLAIAGANSVSISGDYAYVGSGGGSGGLYVVDISTPASPTQVGSLVTGNKDAVKVRGDYVYMSAGGTDFAIVDVSTPTSPVQVGTVAIRVDAIKLVGDYAYTVSYSNDSMTVIDVSDPTSPTSVDTITNANLDQSWGVDVVGTYVYVASAGTADALTVIDTGCNPSIVVYDDTLANLTCTDGQIVSWDDTGSAWVCADGGLSALSCSLGQVAAWDGSAWGCASSSGTTLANSFTTPGSYSWVVPAGVTSIDVKAWGAGGGGSPITGADAKGGSGGYTTDTLTVTPGETLTVVVGAGGQPGVTSGAGGAGGAGLGDGGDGSGSNGSYTSYRGGGGGGGSGLKRSATILTVAGGGGGGGSDNDSESGGPGGGTTGSDSTGCAASRNGKGGTQSAVGAAGSGGSGGTAASGNDGGDAAEVSGIGMGGGGGGYYGGGSGGGAWGSEYCGGGGGSGFTTAGTTLVGTGATPPSQSDDDYVSGVALGGNKAAGGDGLVVISYAGDGGGGGGGGGSGGTVTATFTCPTGFTKLESQGQTLGCIQDVVNSAATYDTAVTNCWDTYGARLPVTNEYKISMNESAISVGSGQFRWASDSTDGYCSAYYNNSNTQGGRAQCFTSQSYHCFIPSGSNLTVSGGSGDSGGSGSGSANIVSEVYTTPFSYTTSGWQDTGYTVTIPVSSDSAKVRVSVSGVIGSNQADTVLLKLVRDSTDLIPSGADATHAVSPVGYASAMITRHAIDFSFDYLDTPGTTGDVVYKLFVQKTHTVGTEYVGRSHDGGDTIATTMIAEEVGSGGSGGGSGGSGGGSGGIKSGFPDALVCNHSVNTNDYIVLHHNKGDEVSVGGGVGTPIGNMTYDGGLAAAFDGSQTCVGGGSTCATMVNDVTTTRTIGKDWGAGNDKTITSAKIYSATATVGFSNGGSNTIYFEGSADNSSWTTLETFASQGQSSSETRETTGALDTSTAYRYHRWRIVVSNTGYHGYVAEAEFVASGAGSSEISYMSLDEATSAVFSSADKSFVSGANLSDYNCNNKTIVQLDAADQSIYYGGDGSGSDTLSGLSCTDGQVASWDDSGSAWVCADAASGGGGGSGGSGSFGVSGNATGNGAAVLLTTLSETFDPDSVWDEAGALDQFKPSEAGTYYVFLSGYSSSCWESFRPELQIRKNGSTVVSKAYSSAPSSGMVSGTSSISVSVLFEANGTTDYIEFLGTKSSCNSLDFTGGGFPISGGGGGADTLSGLSCTDGQVASWDNSGTAWVCSAGGGSDNLGDHTATTTLDMASQDVDSVKILNFIGTAGDQPLSLAGAGLSGGGGGACAIGSLGGLEDMPGLPSTVTENAGILPVTTVNCEALVNVSGGGSPEYRICSNDDCSTVVSTWTSDSGSIEDGQYVQVRATPPGVEDTEVTVYLGVGSESRNYKLVAAAAHKKVFITNTTTKGNIGGIAGGDSMCSTDAATYEVPGSYMAWLATGAADDPDSRFTTKATIPYRNAHYPFEKIADDWTDLTDGTLTANITKISNGGTSSRTWTAVSNTGTNQGDDCNNWTDNGFGTLEGRYGRNSLTNWTQQTNRACDTAQPIYCFEQ